MGEPTMVTNQVPQVAVTHPPSHCASPPVAPRGAAWRRSTADRCRWRRRSDRCRGPASCDLGDRRSGEIWTWTVGIISWVTHHLKSSFITIQTIKIIHSSPMTNGLMVDSWVIFWMISIDFWGSMRINEATHSHMEIWMFHATAEDLPVENYQ